MNWVSDDTTVVQLLTALSTPTLACLGLYIAWAQWNTNKANLKEKLYDRRFQVFKETQNFLSEILQNNEFTSEQYVKFVDACQRSRFLFGRSLQTKLFEIRARATSAHKHEKIFRELNVGTERTRHIELHYADLEWLNDRLPQIFDIFAPYLDFERH